jgi:hypothetical protein
LGSFCTIRPQGLLPPGRAGIGFVSHILLSGALADRRNWVRFAQSPRAGRRQGTAGWASRRNSVSNPQSGKLASFRTIGLPDTPSPRYPILPKFGLVLRNCAPGPRSGCSKLGSFCTFCPRRPRPPAPIPAREKLGLFCILRPRGSGAAGLSPIRNPKSAIGKLGSFCTFSLSARSGPSAGSAGLVSFGAFEPTCSCCDAKNKKSRSPWGHRGSVATRGDRRRKNRRTGERSFAPAARSPSAPSRAPPATRDLDSRLRGSDNAGLHVFSLSGGHHGAGGRPRRGWPYLLYRRLSRPVCCAKTKNQAEILPAGWGR